GLVCRLDVPGDRRAVLVQLSEVGQKRQREWACQGMDVIAGFFRARLSEAERVELARLLRRLLEGLDRPACRWQSCHPLAITAGGIADCEVRYEIGRSGCHLAAPPIHPCPGARTLTRLAPPLPVGPGGRRLPDRLRPDAPWGPGRAARHALGASWRVPDGNPGPRRAAERTARPSGPR